MDAATREALAVALRDRQLTASMRAAHPFIFRTGGGGGGTKVWTVRAAIAHMNRYPEDGIYHLRNGTLAGWLADEGAAHLAKLARAVVQQTRPDPREALEVFLIGSGLVARPRLSVRPKTLDLGYILAGESAGGTFRIAKRGGRGYLFGTVESREPWLHAGPRSFSGGTVQVLVDADTSTLAIGEAARRAEIRLHTNASEEPIVVPVRLHVNAMPAPLHRYLVRPLASAAVGLALGAAAGLVMQSAGSFRIEWPASLAWLATIALWPAVAALWMLCGLAIGLQQPPAWPVRHAVARWLPYVGAWVAGLIGMALVGMPYWTLVNGTPMGSPPAVIGWALGLAVLPGTVHALRANAGAGGQAQEEVGRPSRAPAQGGDVCLRRAAAAGRALCGAAGAAPVAGAHPAGGGTGLDRTDLERAQPAGERGFRQPVPALLRPAGARRACSTDCHAGPEPEQRRWKSLRLERSSGRWEGTAVK